MTESSMTAKLAGVDGWVRAELAALSELAEAHGCVPQEEAGPGRAYRWDGRVVLRLHPKKHHLGVAFPDALRADVAALTGALREQRRAAWVSYAPDTVDRASLELLLQRAVDDASPSRTGAGPGGARRPGRDDETDLKLVLSVVRAIARYQREGGRSSGLKVLREAIFFHWEGPRLPTGGKYAPSLPHSAAARARRDSGVPGGLVYEHAVPLSIVLAELLADLPTSTAALSARLDAHPERVVVTTGEDQLLTAQGLRAAMPDRDNVWSRYQAVGIDPEQFAPWHRPGAETDPASAQRHPGS